MAPDTIFVFLLLATASILFASGRARLDVVALGVVLALMLSGVLTEREALAGFGDPVVLLVAGLLVVGESLTRTGVAITLGEWISRFGGSSETRLLVVLMVAAAALGSIMSSTAVVAIFIPVVLNIAGKTDANASRLLIPLSYGALISGMMTLIATTPNIVVAAELDRYGFEPFGFFSFTPIGAAVLIASIAYMLVLGRRLLPGESVAAPKPPTMGLRKLAEDYGVAADTHRLQITPDSALAGSSLRDSALGTRFNTRVLALERHDRGRLVAAASPTADRVLRVGDVLVVYSDHARANALTEALHLTRLPIDDAVRARWLRDLGFVAVLIHPESRLLGKTVRDAAFRSRFDLQVMALKRRGDLIDNFVDEAVEIGDALLVMGTWKKIEQLQSHVHDFVVLHLPAELAQIAPAREKAPLAILILAGMVLLSALEIVPVVVAVLMAALAVVLTKCLTMEDAYRAIHWSSLVLIAGMLPIADALQKTGGVDLIVGALVSGLGDAGPYAMMTGLFFLTGALGLFLSNTATAVLMAPSPSAPPPHLGSPHTHLP